MTVSEQSGIEYIKTLQCKTKSLRIKTILFFLKLVFIVKKSCIILENKLTKKATTLTKKELGIIMWKFNGELENYYRDMNK